VKKALPSPSKDRPVSAPRILIVDDDTALLEALPKALKLRMDGIRIDTSDNAADAIERIERVDYDAVVTDIKMPGMDGLAVLGEIKRLRPRTPTLLITGHGEHDLAVQALRGGAYDFVQKPIDRDYFVASLERAIEVRRLERRVEEQRLALERHARVLEHVDDGVVLVDNEGLIQHWNPAAQAITGLSADEVLGRPVDDAVLGWNVIAPLAPVATEPGPDGPSAKTLPLELGGKELWLSISGVKFGDGIVYAFRNVTEERALEELKGEFVATVSHELRTPLAAIYGSAQTLQRTDLELEEETRARLLHVITDESERLTRIAGDILLANTLDSGRLRLEESRVDLGTLARNVVEEMRACFADRDDISIDLAGGDVLAAVVADEDRLRQVLINLVDNAVKYSPDGGSVLVEIEPLENSVRIGIRDQGIGIPSTEQQRIFGKFYRVDPQLSRGVGGTGLGLYICRELVRRMQGRVSVISREGDGSTFFVDLPVAKAPAPSERAAVSH
jgi:PAS domain S-box-containing protein